MQTQRKSVLLPTTNINITFLLFNTAFTWSHAEDEIKFSLGIDLQKGKIVARAVFLLFFST